MSPEEFRRAGHTLVEWIADYKEQLGEGRFPVQAKVKPGDLIAALPTSAPLNGEPMDAILKDLDTMILPGITHWQHPRFFGYFPSAGALPSVLADMVSTALGVIGLNWQSSPALTELEQVTTDWVRDLLGLPATFSAVIQDTASVSSLVALICARERASNFSGAGDGLQNHSSPLIVYTSAHAHSSVAKAAVLAGFGRTHVRLLEVDTDFRLRVDRLEASICADRARGLTPCAIVATTGTTSTTAMDPLEPIAAIAQRYGLWLHVDAAMGGGVMLLPECRAMWGGIEHADSIVVNAHKWLGTAFDCSLYFVRDAQHLVRVMSTNPSYLQTAVDCEVRNYRDWGIPLGRRFRALKLWFVLREQGVEAIRARLRRDLENAQWLAARVDAVAPWHRIAPVPLQTVCVRHEPPGLDGEALDQHTLRWLRQINDSGFAYLTPAVIDGRWIVRISIGAELTEHDHVAALWRRMQETAEASVRSA
jgi:aromatic-L-amino-acid/L-tryptophan decarboxylase